MACLLVLCNQVDDLARLEGTLGVLDDLLLHDLLRVLGLGTHVGEEDDVVHRKELWVDVGLVREDVEAGRVELAGLEGGQERRLVDDSSSVGGRRGQLEDQRRGMKGDDSPSGVD